MIVLWCVGAYPKNNAYKKKMTLMRHFLLDFRNICTIISLNSKIKQEIVDGSKRKEREKQCWLR